MHTHTDITIDSITKVEGNAGLKVKVRGGKVKDLKFIIADYRRFYTEAVVGKHYKAVPPYLSRICGTCSMAHLFASIEAVERALGIYSKLSEQTFILRKLSINGMMIRDHCLHLYLFVLPDLLNIDSVLDIEDDDEAHTYLHDAFDLKAVGNDLSTIVSGASVHAPFPTIGGFNKIPQKEKLENLVDDLEKSREKILRGIELFYNWEEKLIRNTDYVALVNKDFNFIDGVINVNNEEELEEKDFMKFLDEIVVPYSQSKGYLLKKNSEDYLVGSLARLNLNKESLNTRTRKNIKKYLDVFPSNNIYLNCLAQAIEVLHCIDESIEIIKSIKLQEEKPLDFKVTDGVGVGVIEAPRGTLYHKIELHEGIVSDAEVIVPTSQNQINIENDLLKMFQNNLDLLSREDLKLQAEKIIRAYDPCMSCATNFLEISWDQK